jgi:hypothetical protein
MNTTSKWLGIVAVAFVAGSFVASSELRAFAANTVFSSDITDGEVKTADLASNAVTAAKIKDAEVKAAEIATDAVGAAEIQGVTKLIFAQCEADSTEGITTVSPGSKVGIACTINGVDGDDSAVADKNLDASCFDVDSADTRTGVVYVWLRNVCTFQTQPGVGAEFSVIVYDK